MSSRKNQRQGVISWVFLGALFLLCAILGHLQYRWIDEVSTASTKRLHANLRTSLEQISENFNSDLATACRALQSSGMDADSAPGPVEDKVAARYAQWKRTGTHTQMFSRIARAVPQGEALAMRDLNLQTAVFGPAEWPAGWQGLKERLETRLAADPRRPGRGPGLESPADGAVFELPILEPRRDADGPPFRRREAGWLIFEINVPYARETVIPELLKHYLPGGGERDYQVEVISRAAPPAIIYQSDPTSPSKIERAADASAGLFDVRFDEIFHHRPMPRSFGRGFRPEHGAGGRWQIYVRHRAGSLEAVVARVRLHNLAVTGSILLLILITGGALLRFTRRSQRLAELQMEFVAGVSHELRTPLTVIHTAAYNLQGRMAREPGQVERYGALIQRESGRLKELVEQVLQFSGAQAGARVIQETEPLSVDRIIDETVEASRGVIQDSHCTIEKHIEPELPRIMADATALKHALENLLNNAVKYGAGGGWIGISAQSVGGASPAQVEIRVADRGPGIPAEEQEHIFDPFYRGRRALQDQVHGTGLGLSLAKRIVEAHGGTIRVRSSAASGTEFIVRIPAAPLESANDLVHSSRRG